MKKILSIAIVIIFVLVGFGAVGISSNKTIVNTNENDTATSVDDLSLNQYQSEIGGEIVPRDWLVVATYSIPEGAAGLAYDGTYLYCGIYGTNGDEVYEIDPDTGSYSLLFNGPQEDAFGLTYDGVYLWTTDHPGSSSTPAVAMQLDMSGNLISQFDLPDHYMSGIAYDSGDFWVATYYPDPSTIYKVDSTGSIIKQFTAPDDQPWDLCLENNNLWMADYWGDTLYKIDPSTGNLLESHSSEGVDPAGIVWDGAYLWYCDNGIDYDYDYLYKVALSAASITADFTADITGGTAPLTVNFTDLSVAENTIITSWKWDFDNDSIIDSEEQNPVWTYTEEGIYTVSLIVSDGTISDTETKVDYITVLPAEVVLEIGNITGGKGVTVAIKNIGDGDATSVKYNITIEGGLIIIPRIDSGDLGTLATGQSVNVTFGPMGIGLGIITAMPKITVTATCAEGSSTEKSADARIILFFVMIQ